MAFVAQLHGGLANTAWLFFLGLGLWGLWRGWRRRPVDGSYMGGLVIGELLLVLQLVLGVILVLSGARVGRMWIHALYGVFSVVFLPFVFAYVRGDDSNRAQWVYALAALFLFGVALRAISTATGG